MDKLLKVLGLLAQLHADIFNDLTVFFSRCRDSEDYISPASYEWDESED